MERIAQNVAAESREQVQEFGFNYDKLNELLTDGVYPAELADHLTQMYFNIVFILTHPQVMDSIGISNNWNVWLHDLESVINSLV